MLPRDLQPEQFAAYPPQARQLAVAHLDLFRQLPISFLPSMLRQVIEYDDKFPAERQSIDAELGILSRLSSGDLHQRFQAFDSLSIPSRLENYDWVNHPAQFVEQQSAYLWSTHQLDNFRNAATQYGEQLQAALPPVQLPARRLGIAIIGQGVDASSTPLFRNLRPHGTFFGQVIPQNGLAQLFDAVTARAKSFPSPYGHWVVDGGSLSATPAPGVTCVSYDGLEPVRSALLNFIQGQIQRPGMGPEELRTRLAELTPVDLGISSTSDQVLSRFQVKILTEGSGTQIFSTTFAQWTAREVLRRAQALTLLVHFTPRQRQLPMNEMLSNAVPHPTLDPAGSLVDADMGAYYNWINQQRLPGAQDSAFIAWFEGHAQAVVIAPTLPRGVVSTSAMTLTQLVQLALA